MSIERRIEKLEAERQPPTTVWLQIVTEQGDTDEAIERLKDEAVNEWKRGHPEQETPTFNWINRVIADPPPRSRDVVH